MTEEELRSIVSEVVAVLAGKGLLGKPEAASQASGPDREKTAPWDAGLGPLKPISGSPKTSLGTAGKVFRDTASWGSSPLPRRAGESAHSSLSPAAALEEGHEGAENCPHCSSLRAYTEKDLRSMGLERLAACHPTKTCSPVARLVDHTLLKPNATQEEIGRLCVEARDYCFASVCIPPSYVHLAARLLSGSGVKVCTVIGFPLGSATSTVKAVESRDAIANGADEIDMVLNIGALKSGNDAAVLDDIRAVREATRGRILKVILETSLLSREEKIRACILSKKAGADFVKTSTGFGGGGATAEDVRLMRETVGPSMGVKASGGIRTAEVAQAMIAAGATRLGTSASVAIVTGADAGGGSKY